MSDSRKLDTQVFLLFVPKEGSPECFGQLQLPDLVDCAPLNRTPFFHPGRAVPVSMLSPEVQRARGTFMWGPQYEAWHNSTTLQAILDSGPNALEDTVDPRVEQYLGTIRFLCEVLIRAQGCLALLFPREGEWRIVAWSISHLTPKTETRP